MADLKTWQNSTFYRKLDVFFVAPLGGLNIALGAYSLIDEKATTINYVGLAFGAYLLVSGRSSIPALRRSYNQEKIEGNLEDKLDGK